jgi:hypothetical protein
MSFWNPFSSSRHHSSSRSSNRPSYARSSSSHGSSGFWTRPHGTSSSSSYYRRRPRDGYIARLIEKFRHLLRELWYYIRRNPAKVFFLVVMPLVSGGALAGMARQFGVKLPDMLQGRGGGSDFAKEMGGSYYGSKGYGREGSSRGGGGGGGGGDSLSTLMNVAKAFL